MGTRIRGGIAALTRLGTAFAFLMGGGTPAPWPSVGTRPLSLGELGDRLELARGSFLRHQEYGRFYSQLQRRRVRDARQSDHRHDPRTGANPWSLDAGTGGTLTVAGINVTGGT